MVYVVMGVAGSGKTTIGRLLADGLGLPFYDADDYHPRSNRSKMAAALPLTDADRLPWLHELADRIAHWESRGGGVLACSALKESYRRILAERTRGPLRYIYLAVAPSLAEGRLARRSGHFFPPELIASQYAALEEPRQALRVDASLPPPAICADLLRRLALDEAAGRKPEGK